MILFTALLQIRKNHNRADVGSMYKKIIKTNDVKNITKEFLDDRIRTLITDGENNSDSYYVNGKYIETESFILQNTSPIIPDKSFYTLIISIPIPSTEKPIISPDETPITTKVRYGIIKKLHKTLIT